MTILQAIESRIDELGFDPSQSVQVAMGIDTFDQLLTPSNETSSRNIAIRIANMPFGMFLIKTESAVLTK